MVADCVGNADDTSERLGCAQTQQRVEPALRAGIEAARSPLALCPQRPQSRAPERSTKEVPPFVKLAARACEWSV